MTVAELDERMTSIELTYWQSFLKIEFERHEAARKRTTTGSADQSSDD